MHVLSIPAVATLVITVATLAGIVTRPKGADEGAIAAIGAVALLLTGLVGWNDVPAALRSTAPVLLFLLGMMVLTAIVERAGIFDVLGEWCVAAARGNGHLLYVLIVLLSAATTILLSLDVTVIMLTPMAWAITRRRGMDPLPFAFICTFVANTTSLLLPVSNLTNLILYEGLDMDFGQFVSLMWLPTLAAIAATVGVLLLVFRQRIPASIPPPRTDPPVLQGRSGSRAWQTQVAIVLAITIGALCMGGFAGLALWIPAVIGGAIMAGMALARRTIGVTSIVQGIAWELFVYVIAMTVVVRAIEIRLLPGFRMPLPASTAGLVATSTAIGAVGSNLINNVPMAVLATSLLTTAPSASQTLAACATLLGTNIGPAITTYGSLATMIWLTSMRQRGTPVTSLAYVRLSLVLIPVVLLATCAALYLRAVV